jgi:protein-tyrosine phosphatase
MYTDIHSHVIWGVDDGAETKEETYKMLREACADGIGRIICTPHVTPGVYEFPEEAFQEHFQDAVEYIGKEGLPLQLYRGAELLWTENTPRLLREHQVATMAGTKYAMIEFSPTDSREKIYDALQKVAGAGFVPIIAHMERYPAIGKVSQVKEMKSRFRAMVQINARSLTRKQPLMRRGFFDSLFKDGYVDFVATDTHSMPGRETCMTAGMTALREKYGEEAEERIRKMADVLLGEGGDG